MRRLLDLFLAASLASCGSRALTDGTGPVERDALEGGADAAGPAPDVAADAGELVDGPTYAGTGDAGTATGKLCHELNRGGQPVALTLKFGGDPATARITAWTGRCSPPIGSPCAVIPAGLVPVRLLEGDKVLSTRDVILTEGSEYVFQPFVATTGQVGITGGRIAPGTCSGLDFPADGGAD